MEGSEELTTLVSALTSTELWEAVVVFTVGFIIVSLIKTAATNIFQFILFKTGLHGIGSYVEYKGKRGIITHIGIRTIYIELENEEATMSVDVLDWKDILLILPDSVSKQHPIDKKGK